MKDSVIVDENEDDKSLKLKTIRAIHNAGLDVVYVIHRHGMENDSAMEVESALIDAYHNLNNEIGGVGASEFGVMNVKEIINKYSYEEAVFKHNVLMIILNINEEDGNNYLKHTRFAWKIDDKKAKKADYVLAVVKGIIKEVFIVDEWKQATIENFPEYGEDVPQRKGFVGRVADESTRKLYINKRIPSSYRPKGAANPIRYSY